MLSQANRVGYPSQSKKLRQSVTSHGEERKPAKVNLQTTSLLRFVSGSEEDEMSLVCHSETSFECLPQRQHGSRQGQRFCPFCDPPATC